jgi:fatty-acid desaturase
MHIYIYIYIYIYIIIIIIIIILLLGFCKENKILIGIFFSILVMKHVVVVVNSSECFGGPKVFKRQTNVNLVIAQQH